MAIRVPARITRRDAPNSVQTTALLNSGFEGGVSELLVPDGLARRLNFLPDLPESAAEEEYEAPGGRVKFHRIPDAVDVRVEVPGESGREIVCTVVISPSESEALLNDTAISALGVEPADPGGGRWRFTGEQGLRQGVPPQHW